MAPSECSVKVQWVGEPVPNPSDTAGVRSFGGRYTYYGSLEIVEASSTTTVNAAISIGVNDIVEVACKRGPGVTNDGIIECDQPFLAQVSWKARKNLDRRLF